MDGNGKGREREQKKIDKERERERERREKFMFAEWRLIIIAYLSNTSNNRLAAAFKKRVAVWQHSARRMF